MLLILLSGCFGPESYCAEADLFYVYAHEDDSFGGCTFETSRDVGGIRCLGKPFTTKTWKDGSVALCYLDGPQTVAGIDFPVDTSVSLFEDGTLSSFQLSPNSDGPSPTVSYRGTSCTKAEIHENGQIAVCRNFDPKGSKGPVDVTCWAEDGTTVDLRSCMRRQIPSAYSTWDAQVHKKKKR